MYCFILQELHAVWCWKQSLYGNQNHVWQNVSICNVSSSRSPNFTANDRIFTAPWSKGAHSRNCVTSTEFQMQSSRALIFETISSTYLIRSVQYYSFTNLLISLLYIFINTCQDANTWFMLIAVLFFIFEF